MATRAWSERNQWIANLLQGTGAGVATWNVRIRAGGWSDGAGLLACLAVPRGLPRNLMKR